MAKVKKSGSAFLIKSTSLFAFCFLIFRASALAAPGLAPARLEGRAVEDLSAPYNLQLTAQNRTVTLSWAWDPPDPSPEFLSFGYEVFRDSAVIAIVPKTAYTDYDVPVGTHTYKVRAKGGSKDLGRKMAHYSAWSESADTSISLSCTGPPIVHLTVEPTKRSYGGVPSLRLHFLGDVKAPPACHVEHVMYHIDSGVSSARSGPLDLDAAGRFDELIDTLGPDEEAPSNATYAISVTASDEAGGTTSDVFTVDLTPENPYAPTPH